MPHDHNQVRHIPSADEGATAVRTGADGDVFVACLHCKTGAVYEPEIGPGAGWLWISETGFACPEHAQTAHDLEIEAKAEHVADLKAKLADAERLRDKHAAEIKRLRGWIESYSRGDWQHTREEFVRYALHGYVVPPVDDRLFPNPSTSRESGHAEPEGVSP